MARGPEQQGRTLEEQLKPMADAMEKREAGAAEQPVGFPPVPETQPARPAEKLDLNAAIQMIESKLATVHPTAAGPLRQRLANIRKLADASARGTSLDIEMRGTQRGLTRDGVKNVLAEEQAALVRDLPKIEATLRSEREADAHAAFAEAPSVPEVAASAVPAEEEALVTKKDGSIDLIGPWKEKYGSKTTVPVESTHNEIPVESLDDLDAAREAIASGEARLIDGPVEKEENTEWPTDSLNDLDTAREAIASGEASLIGGAETQPSEEEQFREIFNTWGEEYQEKEKGLSPEAAAQMREDAAHLEAAGIEADKAKGLTFAVDAFMASPSGFMHPEMLTALKSKEGSDRPATPEVTPLSPEDTKRVEVIRENTASFEKAVDARIPEKHKPFFERIQQRLDSFEKYYSKLPWGKKAMVSATLIGLGIAGATTAGTCGVTFMCLGWAGGRVASYLGAYSMMRGFTKEENLDRPGLQNVHRGTALAYAIFMPHIVEALNAQFGIGEKIAQRYADWFGAGTPTPPSIPAAPTGSGFGGPNTEINPLLMGDEPVPLPSPTGGPEFGGRDIDVAPLLMGDEPVPSAVPTPESPEAVEPRTGGTSSAFAEPSAEMARYFEGKIAVKPGNTVWGLIQERLGPNGSPADVLKRVEYLKSLPADELKKLGIGPWQESFKGFMIKPGDMLDLSSLDTLGPPKGGIVWNPIPAAAVAPIPEPIPAGVSYEQVATNKFNDIQTIFGPTGLAGENAFHTQGWNVPVEKYLQANLELKSSAGPIPGLSVDQVSKVREYIQAMATQYSIPQTGTLEQFMNKVAIAKSR